MSDWLLDAIDMANHYVTMQSDRVPLPDEIQAIRLLIMAVKKYAPAQPTESEARVVQPAADLAAELISTLNALSTMESIIANPVPCPAWHRLAQVASEIGYLTARLEGMTR
jgi:hypothetical protein